jgi:hypothetical protein
MQSRIMYIKFKGDGLEGPGRKALRKLKGGFKANHFDVATGEEYWISGPKRNGQDRLYSDTTLTPIDEDVREEYWRDIRKRPDLNHQKHT